MKATFAVLCFLVAVAYALKPLTTPRPVIIDEGALNPRCVAPLDKCPGNVKIIYYYNRTSGCQQMHRGNCSDNGNYPTLQECQEYCLPAPGKQVRLA
uniref:Putative secreted salivary protein n=1 Tax=Ixodes scapularis TaxID=6945 RepID=Q4PMQ6_IXOSC|nr:putative secreted salivary protein [Ixodes scapularis]